MFTFFISDLHLSEHEPDITAQFLTFINKQAPQADALYILGDLFEMWIGDDDKTAYNSSIIASLKQLSSKVPVYFMAGNRDFMVGQRFATASGSQLLADPSLIYLYGKPTLLIHGDFLCTKDKGHIAFRRLTQKAWIQHVLMCLPLRWRGQIGIKLRNQSKQRNKRIASYLMDVDQDALAKIMQHYQVKQLIHGHTHRPSIHYFLLNNELVKRIVLSDWDVTGNVLRYDAKHNARLLALQDLGKVQDGEFA